MTAAAVGPVRRRADRTHGGAVPFAAAVMLMASVGPVAATAAAAGDVPEPAGYRLDEYRAPTPRSVSGGRTIDTAEARALWEEGGAVWVDVLPAPRRPEGQRPEAVWKPIPRRDIPGSIWLPDVGRGELSPERDGWFRDNLATATHGDRTVRIVFYCLADCWMSWNATKRAASYGYTALYWYRDGTDGWEEAKLPTAVAEPASGAP
ncbi:MAG TPA: PQQ-dependent catabolism-associated CXXCW motif protein [Stellaceae bacterium]|jgi:PQQ-dependent catabolism-associated CXXCW motif protein